MKITCQQRKGYRWSCECGVTVNGPVCECGAGLMVGQNLNAVCNALQASGIDGRTYYYKEDFNVAVSRFVQYSYEEMPFPTALILYDGRSGLVERYILFRPDAEDRPANATGLAVKIMQCPSTGAKTWQCRCGVDHAYGTSCGTCHVGYVVGQSLNFLFPVGWTNYPTYPVTVRRTFPEFSDEIYRQIVNGTRAHYVVLVNDRNVITDVVFLDKA